MTIIKRKKKVQIDRENIYQANTYQKEDGAALLISDKTGFRANSLVGINKVIT